MTSPTSHLRLRLANRFIFGGRRSRSERTVAATLFALKGRLGRQREEFLLRALDQLTPRVRLRSKRKAGLGYKIPLYLLRDNGSSYALRWLRSACLQRRERGLSQRLLAELQEAHGQRGEAHRKRESVHQTALLNRGLIRLLR